MTIQEIETAVAKLPHEAFRQLMKRLPDFAAGHFSTLTAQARKDIAEGRGVPL